MLNAVQALECGQPIVGQICWVMRWSRPIRACPLKRFGTNGIESRSRRKDLQPRLSLIYYYIFAFLLSVLPLLFFLQIIIMQLANLLCPPPLFHFPQ